MGSLTLRLRLALALVSSYAALGAFAQPVETAISANAPASTVPGLILGAGMPSAPSEGLSLNQAMTLNRLGLSGSLSKTVDSNNDAGLKDQLPSKKSDDSEDKLEKALFKPVGLNETEFQRFVYESSGKGVPLFGYHLFGQARFAQAQNVPPTADYVLGPGDEVIVHLWGSVEAAFNAFIDKNGQINLPRVGAVQLAGTQASQLESSLRQHFGKLYKGFQLNATVGKLRSIRIFSVGHVRTPGAHLVSNVSTLLSAVFDMGGPSATGSMRNIELKRNGKVITSIDFYEFMISGDQSKDVRLQAGDVIVFPPAGPRVAVLGSIETPAIYELKSQEESIHQILQYGGGVLALTNPHKSHLERINTTSPRAPRTVEDRVLDAKGVQSKLRDGDVLTLFKISSEFSNAVTLRGNVASPLRYAFKSGMRISDLIPEKAALIQGEYYSRINALVQYESGKNISANRVAAETRNMLEEINWDYASIERLDKDQLKTRLIHFNLYKAIVDRNPEHNLQLQPGDIVTVFSINDVPVPAEKRTQFVTIGGEVRVPGVYQIKPGETLRDLLQRAGGITPSAYLYGSIFTRESNRAKQQAQINKALHELEVEVSKLSLTKAQNLDTSPSQGNHIAADIAMQQQLLGAMKRVKPTGRVALELDQVAPALPDILLEDGDRLTVPARPSFVGVFGAVFADSSLLYKPGHSVRDYLRSAGLKKDADTENAMLVRADGSVEAIDANGIFGSVAIFSEKKIYPGDSIYIPEKFDRETAYNKFVRGAKDWTAIIYQLTLGAAAIKTLRD